MSRIVLQGFISDPITHVVVIVLLTVILWHNQGDKLVLMLLSEFLFTPGMF